MGLDWLLAAHLDDVEHAHDAVDRRAEVMAHAVHEVGLGLALHVDALECFLETAALLCILLMEGGVVFEEDDAPDSGRLLTGFGVVGDAARHQHRLLDPDKRAVGADLLVFDRGLRGTACKALEELVAGVDETEALERLLRNIAGAIERVLVVRARRGNVERATLGDVLAHRLVQHVVGEVHGVHRLRGLEQRLDVVAVFEDGVLELVVIARQLLLLVSRIEIERLEAQREVVELPVRHVIERHDRQTSVMTPADVGDFDCVLRADKLRDNGVEIEELTQGVMLDRYLELPNHLLHGTRVASLLREEIGGARSQAAVAVELGIAVQAIRELEAPRLDLPQQVKVVLVALGCLSHLGAVLIDVHVLVCEAIQLADCAALVFCGERAANGIADGHAGALGSVFAHVVAQALEKVIDLGLAGIADDGDKLVSAVAADKHVVACKFCKLVRKRADVLVAFRMTVGVVDGAQVVEIEGADGNSAVLIRGLGTGEQLDALALVGKPRRLVEVDLLLQRAVERREAKRPQELEGDEENEADNVCDNDLFKEAELSGFGLRIIFCQRGCLIADCEELLALGDNTGVFVALCSDERNLAVEGVKVLVELQHLVLVGLVVDADEVEVLASVHKALDIAVHALDELVLRLLGDFELDDALGGAAHEAGVVDNARRALDVVDELGYAKERDDEYDGADGYEHPDNAVELLVPCLCHTRFSC